MLNTQEIEVDEQNYSITQIPVRRGRRVLTKLMKVLTEPVVEFLATAEDITLKKVKEIMLKDLLAKLGPIAITLVDRVDEETHDYILDSLLAGVKFENKKLEENHFAGRYEHMYRVAYEAMKVNYGDFFDSSLSRHGFRETVAAAQTEVQEAIAADEAAQAGL